MGELAPLQGFLELQTLVARPSSQAVERKESLEVLALGGGQGALIVKPRPARLLDARCSSLRDRREDILPLAEFAVERIRMRIAWVAREMPGTISRRSPGRVTCENSCRWWRGPPSYPPNL